MSIMSDPNVPIGIACAACKFMRSSRLARSTGSQWHHAHSTDLCQVREVGNGSASKHAHPMRTARMRATASWAVATTSSIEHADRRVRRSSFQHLSTPSVAPHAHFTQPTDDDHRAEALAKQQLAAKLVQPPFASTPAECSNHTLW